MRYACVAAFLLLIAVAPAEAGPPYITDDPEPTDEGHFEVYAFSLGTATRDGTVGQAGIDFNYGGAPDLQLTAVVPLGYAIPTSGPDVATIGNVQLAAKYRFLHQDDIGVDVAFFPRVFLPAGSPAVGARNTSLLLPIWIGHNWEKWGTFGGGGCQLNRGYTSENFCEVGWVVTNQIMPDLQIGAEVFYQTSPTIGSKDSTYLGVGAIYDLNENFHFIASVGPGVQNAAATDSATWYFALLSTF